jgi:NAD(P)-dependent dehydrogenase (short-subunit alcohol dehydrogenase family)
MSEQRPLGSGFGPATTAAEVVAGQDLRGKVAIVTGGYSGLGLVAAQTLAKAGAEVVVPARDEAKARAAMAGGPPLQLETLDLMDPASIDAFARRFLDSGRPLHLLVNSAGIMAPPLTRDARGYESQFSTNHLGHFQLTARLWPALQKAGGARVVQVSSRGHARGGVTLDDVNYERREYVPWEGYAQSKSANILFAVELDERGQGDGVRAFSLHPGGIMTNLGRFTPAEHLRAFDIIDAEGKPVVDPSRDRKSPEQGAATIVWCAVSPQLDGEGGVYCEDCDIAQAVPDDGVMGAGVRPWAIDKVIAGKLWALSETLTGVKFL